MAVENYSLRDGGWMTIDIDPTAAHSAEVSSVLANLREKLGKPVSIRETDLTKTKPTQRASKPVIKIQTDGVADDCNNFPAENQYGGRELAMRNGEIFLQRILVILLTQRDFPYIYGLEQAPVITESDLKALKKGIEICEEKGIKALVARTRDITE